MTLVLFFVTAPTAGRFFFHAAPLAATLICAMAWMAGGAASAQSRDTIRSFDGASAVCYLQTPEILVGPNRSYAIANMSKYVDPMRETRYADPGGTHADGKVYLDGFWRFSPEGKGQGIVFAGGDGYLAMRYHAPQVVAVMKPENGTQRVTVTQDGKPVAREDAGADIHYDGAGNSYLSVDAPRAYDVIVNRHFGTHELRFAGGLGVGIYDMAFESCEIGSDK